MYGFNKTMLKGAVNPLDFVISVVIVVIVVAAVFKSLIWFKRASNPNDPRCTRRCQYYWDPSNDPQRYTHVPWAFSPRANRSWNVD